MSYEQSGLSLHIFLSVMALQVASSARVKAVRCLEAVVLVQGVSTKPLELKKPAFCAIGQKFSDLLQTLIMMDASCWHKLMMPV
jgi:hypothetical protein